MPFKKQIGKKKLEFELQELISTPDNKNDYGEEIPQWVTRYHLRGTLLMAAGRESPMGMTEKSNQSYIINARYRPNITTDRHRLKCGARIFDIQNVNNVDEMNREIFLLVKENVVT